MKKTHRELKPFITLTMLLISVSISFSLVYAVIDTPTLSAYTVMVGDIIVVSGDAGSVPAGAPVKVYWDFVVGPNAHLLNTTTGGPDGRYEVTIEIPSTPNGNHYVWVEDTALGYFAMSDAVTVIETPEPPEIYLSTSFAPPGTSIIVHGYNFSSESPIVVSIEKDDWTYELTTTTTLIDGSFNTSFVLPAIAFDIYNITVEDGQGNQASVQFKIGLITVIINPSSGPPGTEVTLTGVGFAPGPYNATLGTYLVIINGNVSAEESISDTFTVPSIVSGEYTLTVIDSNQNELAATFIVLESDYTLILKVGWNMVSFPLTPVDSTASSVLSELSFYQLVTWSGTGYIVATEFELGKGYWLLVLEETNVTISGTPIESLNLNLSIGWSMIGGPNNIVAADDVFPGFYQLVTWTGTGYTPATVFGPGKGYWALVLEETQIQLPPT